MWTLELPERRRPAVGGGPPTPPSLGFPLRVEMGGQMRSLSFVCLLLALGSCKSNDDKDREIAALKAQLAATQPEAAPAPPAVVAPAPAPAADNTALPAILATNADGDRLLDLLTRADADAKENGRITYAHLTKNADRYTGRPWVFTGRILEISESEKGTFARVSLGAYGTSVVAVQSGFQTEFVQGNAVDIHGALAGNLTYQSQAGWTITVPQMLAMSIQRAGTFARLRAAAKKGGR